MLFSQKNEFLILFFILVFCLMPLLVNATVVTYTTSTQWTAPAGVIYVKAEVWGGGGGGGGQNLSSDGGGGGGGGAYSSGSLISVTPGNSYNVTVGGGGVGGTGCSGATNGGDSSFISSTTIFAEGGKSGSCSTGSPPPGGLGGSSVNGVGSIRFSGGQGEKGRNNSTGQGGYGGSSAGTAADGWSGPQTWSTITYPTGNTPTGAGDGGNGGGANANGSAPASGNGGGGGGAGEGTNRLGGNGASGKVVLTYSVNPTLSISKPDGISDTVTVGATYNITYSLSDSDDVITAAFFYDIDNTGLNGTAISGACATAAEGTNVTCSWDTTGMTPGTYYVYGITNDGTNPQVSAYSSGPITINAAVSIPTVSTDLASPGIISSLLNGNISNTGGATISARGFAWGTNPNLSGGDTSTTTESGSFSTGTFSQFITGLLSGKTYYFRAYATNTAGTGYGNITSFTTNTDNGISRTIRLFEGFILKILSGKIIVN